MKFRGLVGVFVLLFSIQCFAISEFGYREKFHTEVLEKFNSVPDEYFSGRDNVKIPYRYFERTVDHSPEVNSQDQLVVILPGRGEPIHKYAETVYDVLQMGHSVIVVGHRGQGESGLVDDCQIQFVRNFEDYVFDFMLFMKNIVAQKKYSKLYLLAHSMGATIGTLYSANIVNATNLPQFDGIALTSPMFDMNTSPYPKVIARSIGNFMMTNGCGKAICKTDVAPLTSSVVRIDMSAEIMKQYSKIQSEKVSYAWATEALKGIDWIQKTKSNLNGIPILMLYAGKDQHVYPQGQLEFCNALSSCTKEFFKDSYHEILMETDSLRDHAMTKIQQFFDKITSHPRIAQ